MSLLTITQQVALKVLGTLPSQIVSAVSSQDPNIQTIIGLINEDGQELSRRAEWQALRNEASFSTVGRAGGILTFGVLTGGAGYASGLSGTYNLVNLTGGTGNGCVATVQIVAGVVRSVTLVPNVQGYGYTAGDVLTTANTNLGGSGAGFQITVGTIGIIGVQNQGSIQSITGPDFGWVIPETIWDRSTRRPLYGPKTAAEWQQLQAQQMQGPWYQFTLRGNNILVLPPPAPGDAVYLEWMSRYWCASSIGVAQPAMVADADVSKLDEQLHVLGTIFRFRQNKRLAYQEDEDKYEAAILDNLTRDGVKSRLDLAGAVSDIYPGVLVPAGNWQIGSS